MSKMNEYVNVKLTPKEIGKLMKKVDSTIFWMRGKQIEEATIREWLEMYGALKSAAEENGTPIYVPKKR